MNIYEALSFFFGHIEFRPGQYEIIENILQGENVIAVLPTGAGKSLCYQLPALLSENFSIVVSPLIALMKDQVDALNRKQETAAFINSTMSFAEAENVLRKISFGKIKLLYCAPERLETILFAEKIKKLNPEYIFIDEAHCISEWGHNFRPSYAKLKDFINFSGVKKVSAFTATATPEVIRDISDQLELKKHKLFVRGFRRENISLNAILTKNKKSDTLHLLRNNPGSAIIYTSSRKQAEEIAGFLALSKISCEFYHAGIDPVIRKKIQEDFLNDNIRVIAATNAFGMGIDKKDIRLIIHYNIPGSVENYYQETGRAGRDGNESFAYLLFDEKDIEIQEYFIEISNPDKTFIQQLYQLICDYGKVAEGNISDREISVNLDFISKVIQKDISRGMLHSALKILESGGYIKVLSDYDKKNYVQILIEQHKLRDILKRSLNAALKDLLVIIVREFGSTIFNKRTTLDLSDLSEKTGLTTENIDSSLEELFSMGFVNYQKITGKENVLLTKPRVSTKKLKLDFKRINENFLRSQNKLQQIVDYVFTSGCRSDYILNYFGEKSSDSCGKCDKCLSSNHTSGMTQDYVKELILRTLYSSTDFLNETSLVKVLVGTEKSPALQNIDTFGSASNINKNDIKTAMTELIAEGKIERNRINAKYLQLSHKGKEFLEGSHITEKTADTDYAKDLQLYNLLREVRAKAAKKFVQSGYIVCPDEVLRAIAEKKPRSRDALLKIPGFNERMFVKTGHDFLEIINEYLKETTVQADKNPRPLKGTLPKNIKETYLLLTRKYSLKDIASLQKLSEAVVSMQIETILEYLPETDISSLSSEEEINSIIKKLEEGITELKKLKEVLPSDISYSIIRIAAAKFKALKKSSSSAAQYS